VPQSITLSVLSGGALIKGKAYATEPIALVLYTVLVAGLAIAGTILYESYVSAPDLADDIANGRSLTNRCVETSGPVM
jgi:hypothetical protein